MTAIYPIESVPLFSSLPRALLEPLQESALRCPYPSGEVIFRQGDESEFLYIVESGEVDIVVPAKGEDLVVATFHTGSYFGEMAVLDNLPRSATARASEDCSLICLPLHPIAVLLERHPEAARRFMGVIIQRLRAADELMTRLHIKNANDIADERMTVGERVADMVARFGGSWTFIISFGGFLALWVIVNSVLFLTHPPDPYPFIFLNLILSCIAALQAPVIMMSQNRQSRKDRLQADLDYQINIKAEFAIQQLHRKIDELRTSLAQRQP